jgi:predicted nucleotidyltransferase
MKLIDLSDNDEKILLNILKKYSSDESVSFFAFGSRVNGKAKRYSDIDIAYENLTLGQLAELKEEIENSNCTITVDFVDLNDVDIEFEEKIRSEMIPFS